jgi:LuxR family maltose regulon positive regulatory protein
MERGQPIEDVGFVRIGRMWLPLVQQALGQSEEALATIKKLQQKEEVLAPQLSFLCVALAIEADLHLQQGNLEPAVRWAQSVDQASLIPAHVYNEFECLTYARVLRAQGQLEEAEVFLLKFAETSQQTGRFGSLIKISIQQALIAHQKGSLAKANSLLEQALQWAEPEGFKRAFLNEGQELAALLPGVRPTAPAFVDALLRAHQVALTGVFETTPPPESSDRPDQRGVEALSEREQEVLRLVAHGMSNREVAEVLYVTVGTVKKHLNNIFGKLGVKNRTQAVAQARRLGLLS